jgi:hypothetical protein
MAVRGPAALAGAADGAADRASDRATDGAAVGAGERQLGSSHTAIAQPTAADK